MKESWYGKVRLGIIHPMIYPQVLKGDGPILETLSSIVEDDFFSAVEVRRPNDQNVLEQMKKLLESANIDVIIAGQPPLLVGKLNLNSEVKEEREKAVADVKQSIDAANFLNAKAVIILSGSAVSEDKKNIAKKLLIESLNEICQYAQTKNSNLAVSLETFDDKIDKKCLVGPTSFAVEIADVVKKKYKNFGLTVDLSHLPLLNEKSKYTLETVKKHLYHIHVGNCILKDRTHPAYGDCHPRFGIVGGENSVKELAEFIKLLFEIGFLKNKAMENPPIISFEVRPLTDESAKVVIANTKRTWQEAWARV
ncbi:MAG: sugar phosphate isomerase/epimerase family protein [Candidatus Firestonebacteria bacterium]